MAWRQSLPAAPQDPSREGDDRAVSPVVGMILVMGVSVMGVLAVLYWGVPTIADMKSDAEFQAVTNQFEDLDSTVDSLTRGTPGETAKRWQPAFERGGLVFEEDSERWIVSADLADGHNWTLSDLYDGDNNFTIANHHNHGASVDLTVDAWTVDAGATDNINVADADDCSSTSDTDEMDTLTLDAGQSQHLCLYHTDDTKVDVDNQTLKFSVTNESSGSSVAEAYLFDVGSIHYVMTMGPSQRDAFHTNGAVVKGEPDDLEVHTDPAFGPPRDAGSSTRFFTRMVELDGTGSFGGSDADQHQTLISLYSTDVLADLDEARSLKVWIDGDTSGAWEDYFLEDEDDYDFVGFDPSGEPDGLEWRPEDTYVLKLIHSVVTMEVT